MIGHDASMRSGSGFGLTFDAPEARRQLHITIGLVTLLAIAVVSAGVAVGGHPLTVKQDVVASRSPVTDAQARIQVSGAKQI